MKAAEKNWKNYLLWIWMMRGERGCRPEEALLIALWDRQFAEAQLRLQQGKNRKASQRASTKECE